MRYISVVRGLGIDVSPIGDTQCVNDLQRELYSRGNFPKGSITGTWNADTYKWLDNIYGSRDDWWNLGACGVRDNLRSSSGSLAFKTLVVTGAEPIVITASVPKTNTPSYGPTSAPGTPGYQPGYVPPATAQDMIFGIPSQYVVFGALAAAFLLITSKKNTPTMQYAR